MKLPQSITPAPAALRGIAACRRFPAAVVVRS
jgi:hypothetical protein